MNNIRFRRIGAYLIDYVFIFLLITMLSQIRFLNPTYEEYAEASSEYTEIIDNLTVDNAVEVAESEEYLQVNYDLSRYSISISIISVLVYLLYFVDFQKWNKGQTLGKKMFNIKVVSDKGSVRWLQMLLREVIIYNLLFQIILILALFICNYEAYMYVSSLVTFISGLVVWISIFMFLLRKDGNGLHDLIAKTNVEDVNGNK